MSNMNKKSMSLNVRKMNLDDVAEVAALEYHNYGFPWSEDDYKLIITGNYMSEVVTHCGEVLGFSVCDLGETSIIINRLVVMECFRRKGVGSFILTRLMRRLRPNGRTRITVYVEELNAGAIKFLGKHKFRGVNIIYDYFDRIPPDNGINTQDAFVFFYKMPLRSSQKMLKHSKDQQI